MILLHLGMPKTGTSVLQNCVVLAQREARASSLLYPVEGRGRAIAHHSLVNSLLSGGVENEIVKNCLKELRIRYCGTALISSEAFTNLLGRHQREILLPFIRECESVGDTQVVMVLRRFDSFLEAMYLQSTRFGNYNQDIEVYARSRFRWMEHFFEGLSELRASLGDRLNLPCLGPGFDTVRYIEQKLKLDDNCLMEMKRSAPNTQKHSWKSQICLLHLEKVQKAVGQTLDRRRIVAAVESGDLRFGDDVTEYHVLPAPLAKEIRSHSLKLATKFDICAYGDAFPPGEMAYEHRTLDFEMLTPADLLQIKQFGGQPRRAGNLL